jgi:hypothetical protein
MAVLIHTPQGAFADSVEQAPADAERGSRFTVKLLVQGVDKGWIGLDDKGWGVISDTAVTFEQYVHSDRKEYFKIVDGAWKDYWLSVNRNAYLGAYTWVNAVSWSFVTTDGKLRLRCGWNGQLLSFYSDSNRYLYAWNDYNVFEVRMVQS